MPVVHALSRTFAVVILAGALAACGESGDRATPPPSSFPDTSRPGTATCVAPERGYRLDFPKSWYTNDAGIAEPCRFFHPEPFTVAPRTEATGLAVSVRINPMTLDDVAPSSERSGPVEVLGRRTTTIDGRPAVRAETRATANGLVPQGTRAVSWFVDAGDGTLVATTSEAAAAGRYEAHVQVLDAMIHSLRLSDRKSTCSTGRSTPAPTPQPVLPQAVSSMRMAIIDAARACDYDKLAQLALAGDGTFTYTFGGGGHPAAFWKEAEAAGHAPLRLLVELLDGPSATRNAGETTQYLWPAAYAIERWEDVPASAREDLRRMYDDDDLRRFAQFGSYAGHRVGITESGDWIFFVGGTDRSDKTTISERARGLLTESQAVRLGGWLARRPRLSGAVDVAGQLRRDSKVDRVTGLAAEVAFFSLLSVFPGLLTIAAGLGALDSLFGSALLVRAQQEVITVLETFLTDKAAGTAEAVEALFEGGSGGVFTFGVVAAVWAASRGMSTVMRTVAEIYDVEDTRSRMRTRVVAVGLALASMVLIVVTLTALVVGPLFGAGRHVAQWLGMGEIYGAVWAWAGVPVAFLALLVWAAAVFHSVPHHHVGWRPHVGGAALTGTLWLLVSAGFRLYLQLFGGNPVFAILGGALVVLVWLYLLSLALLLGAELNAVLAERAEASGSDRELSPVSLRPLPLRPGTSVGG